MSNYTDLTKQNTTQWLLSTSGDLTDSLIAIASAVKEVLRAAHHLIGSKDAQIAILVHEGTKLAKYKAEAECQCRYGSPFEPMDEHADKCPYTTIMDAWMGSVPS